MAAVTLYQFQLCPFCHKVRAALELKGVPYDVVEVNPMTKRELPPLPEGAPKKVPVLRDGADVVFDSSRILEGIDERFDGLPLWPADETARARAAEIERWVNDELAAALPTVIYGSWREAAKAAQVTARTSNFGLLHNIGVRAGGPLIMHQVAKRILAKRGRKDGHAWIEAALDQLEAWLGDAPYLTGATVSVGDAAAQGTLQCVREFPVFERVRARPALSRWFDRVQECRRPARERSSPAQHVSV